MELILSNGESRGRAPRALVALFVSGALLVVLGASCARSPQVTTTEPTLLPMRESSTLTTGDNVRIAADWYPVAEPRGWTILLHMMPATKESYAALAAKLQERGIASLAIDSRGHGASDGGPKDSNNSRTRNSRRKSRMLMRRLHGSRRAAWYQIV